MGRSGRLGPALAVVSTVLVLSGLEAAGRVLIPTPRPPLGMVLDDDIAWALPPSSTLRWRNGNVRVNSLGMRGAEPLAGAAVRVLTLGDSSVFGDGVSDEQTFSAVLSHAVDADVQNGGVPGFTCPQSLALLERLRPAYDADIAVVYNMHSDAWIPGPGASAHAPLELYATTGIARLLGFGRVWARRWRGQPATSLHAYQACLFDIAASQAERGGRTIFVVPIADVDFIDDADRPPHPADAAPGLDAFRGEMARAAAESGSPRVDLPAEFAESGLSQHEALLDPVHPSGRGHAVIAAALAVLIE